MEVALSDLKEEQRNTGNREDLIEIIMAEGFQTCPPLTCKSRKGIETSQKG